MPVATRALVARPVAVRAPAVRLVMLALAVPVGPAGPAGPAGTVLREWVRSARRALPAVLVVRVARVVPPGPAGCAVMVAWAVRVVWVAVVVMGR